MAEAAADVSVKAMKRAIGSMLVLLTLAACGWNKPRGGDVLPPAEAPLPPDGAAADRAAETPPPADRPPVSPPNEPERAAGEASTDTSRPIAAASATLDWHTSFQDDTVMVELKDATSHYRVEKVELLGPNGVRIASDPLTRSVERNFGYSTEVPPGSVVVGVFGGSTEGVGLGVGANKPLGIRDTKVPSKTTTRARITVPDPTAYRGDAKAWKIAVELLDSEGSPAFFVLPAPVP